MPPNFGAERRKRRKKKKREGETPPQVSLTNLHFTPEAL